MSKKFEGYSSPEDQPRFTSRKSLLVHPPQWTKVVQEVIREGDLVAVDRKAAMKEGWPDGSKFIRFHQGMGDDIFLGIVKSWEGQAGANIQFFKLAEDQAIIPDYEGMPHYIVEADPGIHIIPLEFILGSPYSLGVPEGAIKVRDEDEKND